MSENLRPWVAYLWECGDEYCNCSQAFISRHHPACKHIRYEWGVAHRIDHSMPSIWEGRFETDGSIGPFLELERTMEAMREYWPEAYESLIDLGISEDEA